MTRTMWQHLAFLGVGVVLGGSVTGVFWAKEKYWEPFLHTCGSFEIVSTSDVIGLRCNCKG